jgi:hypothetical protein
MKGTDPIRVMFVWYFSTRQRWEDVSHFHFLLWEVGPCAEQSS